jgi:very-short-patch-repair endonuclease
MSANIIDLDTTSIKFDKNLEDLILYFNTRKDNILTYLKKHFKEDIHFITKKEISLQRGKYNKRNIFMTNEVFELIKSSYNIKHRYVPLLRNVEQVKTIMSLENQTIGFIDNIFNEVFKLERQFKISKYIVDLLFLDYNLIIECDEFGHNHYSSEKEKNREEYLLKEYSIIRYNPNDKNFDVSYVIKAINKVVIKNENIKKLIITFPE